MKELLQQLAVQMLREGVTFEEATSGVRKELILVALRKNRGNQVRAARDLRLHRNTVSRWLDQFDINVRAIRRECKQAKADVAHEIDAWGG